LVFCPCEGSPQQGPHTDEITLERVEGQLGPFYSVTVRKNGEVIWWGRGGVRVERKVHSRIPPSSAAKLFESAHAMNFFTVRQVPYDGCVSDGPEVTITMKEAGRERRISSYCEITEGLGELANEIDEKLHTIRWVFVDVPTLKKLIVSGSFNIAKSGDAYMGQAINWDNGDVIQILLKHGLNVNARTPNNETYLMTAVLGNKYEAAKTLLEAGANPLSIDQRMHETPAINAGYRSANMVKLFLDKHVPVDDTDDQGWTMLMGAACQAHLDAVQLIVEAGANVNARNAQGQTAIGVAEEYRDKYYKDFPETLKVINEVIDYLHQHGGVR
jgi:hypothetical protein